MRRKKLYKPLGFVISHDLKSGKTLWPNLERRTNKNLFIWSLNPFSLFHCPECRQTPFYFLAGLCQIDENLQFTSSTMRNLTICIITRRKKTTKILSVLKIYRCLHAISPSSTSYFSLNTKLCISTANLNVSFLPLIIGKSKNAFANLSFKKNCIIILAVV